MTVCQASRSGNGPLVAVAGSQSAASTVIRGGLRHARHPPAGIAISRDGPFLRSSRDFKHSQVGSRFALLDQGSGRSRGAHVRRAAPERDSNASPKIAPELSWIRIQ